jgi:DNA polymerase III delta prime subunit
MSPTGWYRRRTAIRGVEGEAAHQRPTDEALVDTDLTPEAKAAAHAAALSLLEPSVRRACAVFLGRDNYDKVEYAQGEVIASLFLECLSAFVRQRGGRITYAIRLGDHGEVLNIVQHAVEVAGQSRQFLREGYLFIHFPNERVVVSALGAPNPEEMQILIGIRSDASSTTFHRQWEAYAREHNYLRNQAFFADGKIIERKKAYTWDDILLPEVAKRMICTHVEGFLKNRLRLKRLGVKSRRGLILSGPPGTGKTLMGKVLADMLDVSFLWVSPGHVCVPVAFERICSLARFVAPTCLFLEDLDVYAEDRDVRSWAGLGELMNQLDGAVENEDIVTIATTNRLELIEKALRSRPGRFDRVVKMEPMDAPCRRRFLGKLLARAVVASADTGYLVEATAEYTGAQIEELANTLYILATQAENVAECTPSASDGKDTGQVQDAVEGRGISITRQLIDAAVAEVQVDRKARLGFHAA